MIGDDAFYQIAAYHDRETVQQKTNRPQEPDAT